MGVHIEAIAGALATFVGLHAARFAFLRTRRSRQPRPQPPPPPPPNVIDLDAARQARPDPFRDNHSAYPRGDVTALWPRSRSS